MVAGPVSPPTEPRLELRIAGLCCGEEVTALRRTVGPVVGSDGHLQFNLLNGKMTVIGGVANVDEVVAAVARAGLEATPWNEPRAERQEAWEERWPSILCAASGLLTVLGLALETVAGRGPVANILDVTSRLDDWPAIAVYLLAIASGIRFVLPRALVAARSLRPDMNLLMTIAVAGAIGIGEWFEAATVSFLFALALLLESWSVGRARRAIESLLELSPDIARYRDSCCGEIVEARVEEVPLGATILVRPGDRVPLDGEILVGETSIDQSPITGESMPVAKSPGDMVFAGTVNGEGALEMRSTKPAAQTTLARIIALVEDAQARRSKSEQWVERFARAYTPAVLGLAIAVALLPPMVAGQPSGDWFYNALVLLVIACPCALVISTPVSVVAGLAAAARAGVLIKGGAFLEAPAAWRIVAFDKTGTLTHGRPRVARVVPLEGHTESELLGIAAALEKESNHPLARAIVEAAEARGIGVETAQRARLLPGRGAEGWLGGRRFWIGSDRLLQEQGVAQGRALELARELENAGHSVVAVGNDRHVCGLLSLADEVRASAGNALGELRRLGVERIVMLTGDNRLTAESVGAQLGIEDIRSGLLPEEKVDAVRSLGRELERRRGSVAMVGDGVNDAPAMAASDCAVAMGAAGADAAIETADVALLSDDLTRLPWLVRHSRRTLAVIRQNVVFALGLKVVFVALTVTGSATLWMAIAADMGASLLVIGNGLTLLRKGSASE